MTSRNDLEPLRDLSPPEWALWQRYIAKADWLQAPFDAPKADMFVYLAAEFMANPAAFDVERLDVLRQLENDLGLGPIARWRILGEIDD